VQAVSDQSQETLPDYRQARTVPVRVRSQASREALVQGAMALWRTKGFAGTTVTDICKAAGVSKALFYVYFARKEDLLLEIEAFTMRDAHLAAQHAAVGRHEVHDVIKAVLATLERQVRQYPPELIFELVLETYRLERQALANGATETDLAFLFLEPFEQARRDGLIPAGADIVRSARVGQMLVADGIRHWAANNCTDPLADPLSQEITALLSGLW
jgi:AcrR family transcriptional regulator